MALFRSRQSSSVVSMGCSPAYETLLQICGIYWELLLDFALSLGFIGGQATVEIEAAPIERIRCHCHLTKR
jgi:hypothetical protein